MPRVIILEGPDGAGKTTLANHLESHHGFTIHHEGPPQPGEDLLSRYAATLHKACHSEQNVVFDRLHLGESVYGPILRGKDLIGGREGQTILQRIISANDVVTVFCLPPYTTTVNNWQARKGQELIQEAVRFRKVYEGYETLRKTIPYGLDYDYTKVDLDLAGRLLMSAFQRRATLPKGVIGAPAPVFLFVGEKANQETVDLPWISLRGSSHYLYDVLKDAGYVEQEMAFVNTYTLDDHVVPLRSLVSVVQAPVVVALGGTASTELNRVGVRHHAVSHPQYWRRFQSKHRDTYVDVLRRIRTEYYASLGNRRGGFRVGVDSPTGPAPRG